MSNEGEYLEMVNDLRDQYLNMKNKLNMETALLKEKITHNEYDLGRRQSTLRPNSTRHDPRPTRINYQLQNSIIVTDI